MKKSHTGTLKCIIIIKDCPPTPAELYQGQGKQIFEAKHQNYTKCIDGLHPLPKDKEIKTRQACMLRYRASFPFSPPLPTCADLMWLSFINIAVKPWVPKSLFTAPSAIHILDRIEQSEETEYGTQQDLRR